jgi:PadR family transcriptional regulator AphA
MTTPDGWIRTSSRQRSLSRLSRTANPSTSRYQRLLTPTSYAILALLAVRPWTTYELAKQFDRSLRWYWPRAQSVLYEEPKRLVADGLATARRGHTGRRPRTVYAITAAGRRAVRAWLDEPGAGPVLEFEALLQVAFADQGTTAQLRALLAAVRADAEGREAEAVARAVEYVATEGPFPDRLPVIALTGKLLLELTAVVAEWARWAEREVAQWPDGAAGQGAPVPDGAFEPGWD